MLSIFLIPKGNQTLPEQKIDNMNSFPFIARLLRRILNSLYMRIKTVIVLDSSNWKQAIVIMLSILVAGCSSPKVEPIPVKTIAEFTGRTSSGGLEIAVDTWTDPEKIQNHFGMNLLSKGIMPFEIAFSNVGAEGGFFLQPELAVILDETGQQRLDSGPGFIGGFYPDPMVSMISPIYTIFAQGASEDAEAVGRHMALARFSDRPLYRTDSNKGFIFPRFDDISKLSRAAAVKFQTKNVRTKQEKTIIVPLKGR